MKAIELTETTFNETIRSGVTLVDFWAPWCGPCKMQIPILDQVAEKTGDKATIAKVNVDDYPAPAAQFDVRGIPTLILFKNGEVIQQFVGVQQATVLTNAIEAALN
jgi:thioredoxin 1